METLVQKIYLLFAWVIYASWQGTVFVCVIMVVQWLFNRRLTARWRYYLWLLVILRLVLPVAPESSISVFNLTNSVLHNFRISETWPYFFQTSFTKSTVERGLGKSSKMPSAHNSTPIFNQDLQREIEGFKRQAEKKTGAPHQTRILIVQELRIFFLAVWLFVALSITTWVVVKNFRFYIQATRKRPITDQHILELLEDCKKEMSVYVPLNIITTSLIKTPTLIGVVRPRLLLPENLINSMSQRELKYIIKHELGHIKQWDIALNWLMGMLSILHWFNPVLWLAFYRMRVDREASCDELVLIRSDEKEKMSYARTVIKLLEFMSRRSWLSASVGILEDKNNIKERIARVIRIKKPSYVWIGFSVLLMISIALVGLTDANSEKRGKKQGFFEWFKLPIISTMDIKQSTASPHNNGFSLSREIRSALPEKISSINIGDQALVRFLSAPPSLSQTVEGELMAFDFIGVVLKFETRVIFLPYSNIDSIRSVLR